MPFIFPDPNVQTTVTAPNGEVWHYINGAWTVAPAINDDQVDIADLNARIEDNIDDIQGNEVSINTLTPAVLSHQIAIQQIEAAIENIRDIDLTNALSALALAQQDIIDLKSKVETLELTSFLILE